MHNIPTLHSTKPVTCHPIPSVWDVQSVSKVVYPMGHFPVWESFQIGHQSRHFTFSLGLEKSNGIFWQLKSDQGDSEQKARESHWHYLRAGEMASPGGLSPRKKQTNKKGWMHNCHQWRILSDHFSLSASAQPDAQRLSQGVNQSSQLKKFPTIWQGTYFISR